MLPFSFKKMEKTISRKFFCLTGSLKNKNKKHDTAHCAKLLSDVRSTFFFTFREQNVLFFLPPFTSCSFPFPFHPIATCTLFLNSSFIFYAFGAARYFFALGQFQFLTRILLRVDFYIELEFLNIHMPV